MSKKIRNIALKLKEKNEKLPESEAQLLNFINNRIDTLKKGEKAKEKEVINQNIRINDIVSVLMAVANLNFDRRAKISGKNDFIDGLAAGVNMMSEELQSYTATLKEKETLLKEIHHRVKNNLQIVQSLLNIQSSYIKDKDAAQKFKDMIDRVRSMALIHESLYRSSDLSRIDFNEYLNSLVLNIGSSFASGKKISITLNIEKNNIFLDINYALPCGLIINELLTNCFKYAFPKKVKGNISVSFEREKYKNKYYQNRIVVMDDGIGLKKNFSVEGSETLGMQLISTLVEQLDGKLEILKIQGAGFAVSFLSKEND